MSKKMVYFFGGNKADGGSKLKNLLGGKGSNLAEMVNIGIPVPAGFTITTEVCTYFYKNNKRYPEGLKEEVEENLKKVEKEMGSKFGDRDNPLLVSVRSGARVSMPGMMDTVLNLGLNDETIQGIIKKTDDERFAYDSYRRFITMFGDVVKKIDFEIFESALEKMKKDKGVKNDTELDTDDLKKLVTEFKKIYKDELGEDFPEDPMDQLWASIGAVFSSWDTPRAKTYRKLNKIPDDWGTAVNVQSMVFGNMGEDSGTGVGFTRDPSSGDPKFYGEFLMQAQGEDVVAGIRTPRPIGNHQKSEGDKESLEEIKPDIYQQLLDIKKKLESHYKDMQDIEFTIQQGKLWMLQTRTGKRTGFAALRIAVDMYEENLITEEEAVLRVQPGQLVQLLAKVFDPKEKNKAIKEGNYLAKGLNAGPGAATGKAVFNSDRAEKMAKDGDKVILVRIETSPEDIHGMAAAQGILTSKGGRTSHAAVVARAMGKPCVAGCGELDIDYSTKKMTVNNTVIKEGDFISIDGITGEVLKGKIETKPSEIIQVLIEGSLKEEDSPVFRQFKKFMTWADKARKLGVRTNADTPKDSDVARKFGAEGIGLTRTEHMFFEGDRIDAMREMILSDDVEGRRNALAKIQPMQKEDFIGIFKVMDGLPVTIRTLDPPLHEFLPHEDDQIKSLAKKMNVSFEKLKSKVNSLKEANPMLGHRGCRLGIAYPEITEMQARAILEAAVEVQKEGVKVFPEIMIPLVSESEELRLQKELVDKTAKKVFEETGEDVKYSIGTMIELPRAAITADKVAEFAEFFSFGTNDLTQTTFGLSRDDAGAFLNQYYELGVLKDDPFQTIDIEGVGELVDMGTKKGRITRKDLKVGICGEHGGDPASVEFCHKTGLNYVSCSPYRVPIARLAAAHAALNDKK